MKKAVIFRLVCIAALWVLVCIWYVDRLVRTGTPVNLRTLFPIVASGIIVGVPLYRKYIKDARKKQAEEAARSVDDDDDAPYNRPRRTKRKKVQKGMKRHRDNADTAAENTTVSETSDEFPEIARVMGEDDSE